MSQRILQIAEAKLANVLYEAAAAANGDSGNNRRSVYSRAQRNRRLQEEKESLSSDDEYEYEDHTKDTTRSLGRTTLNVSEDMSNERSTEMSTEKSNETLKGGFQVTSKELLPQNRTRAAIALDEDSDMEEKDYTDGEDEPSNSSEEDSDSSDDSSETALVALELNDLNMTEIPPELIDLLQDKVSKLSLLGNWLTNLPDIFDRMAQLEYVDLSRNHLTEFPSVLHKCASLAIIDLRENQISVFPEPTREQRAQGAGYLEKNLRVLSLSHNRFKYLPPYLAKLTALQLVEIEGNPIVALDATVAELVKTNGAHDPEWIYRAQDYLQENASLIEAKIAQDVELQIQGRAHYGAGPGGNSAYERDRATSFGSTSESEDLEQDAFEAQAPRTPAAPSVPPPTERLRSNSESQASRAAKRMGLIVRKPPPPVPLPAAPQSEATTPTNATRPGLTLDLSNQSFKDFSRHARGVSHDSTLERQSPSEMQYAAPHSAIPVQNSVSSSQTNLHSHSTSHSTTSHSHSRQGSQYALDKKLPLPGYSSNGFYGGASTSPSAPSSPYMSSREPSPSASRSGSADSIKPFPNKSAVISSSSAGTTKELTANTNTTTTTITTSMELGSTMASPVTGSFSDSSPGAYFKRLSTLPEEMRTKDRTQENLVVEASHKVLFSVHELYEALRRYSSSFSDKELSARFSILLQAARSTFPDLVQSLEQSSSSLSSSSPSPPSLSPSMPSSSFTEPHESSSLLASAVNCIAAMRNLVDCFQENIHVLEPSLDIKFMRVLVMTCFTSLNELFNAWTTLQQGQGQQGQNQVQKQQQQLRSRQGSSPEPLTNSGSAAVLTTTDEQLYDRVYAAAKAAQSVLGQLTQVISQNAMETAAANNQSSALANDGKPSVASIATAKMRDLTAACVSGVDVTRRLKTRMETMIHDKTAIDRRKFWDDLNGFLKAVIVILANIKAAMNYLPFLDEVRPSIATLTRVTKEIPVLLEYSSFKVMMNEPSGSSTGGSGSAGGSSSNGAMSNPTMNMNNGGSFDRNIPIAAGPPPPTTPLVAVLGPAAQAVMSPQSATLYQGYSPFIPEGHRIGE